MHRFIVVPLRVQDDVALARYSVPAAHAEGRATVAIDLTSFDDLIVVLEDLLAELQRTVCGNGQRFVVLADAARLDALAPAAAAAIAASTPDQAARYDELEACLTTLAPVAGSFAVKLTVPSRVEYLAPLRRYFSDAVNRLHGEADAFHAEILVDELCLNAVENSPSDRNAYDILFACEGDELRMEVTNAFDESINSERIMHRRLQSFDDSGDYLGERGRGLFLIARIADGLQIRSLPEGRMRVSVSKRLGRQSGALPEGARTLDSKGA